VLTGMIRIRFLALLAMLGVALGSSGKIACFGDSWAAFACDNLEGVLRLNLRENDVENKGVSGSTAGFWVKNMDLWVDLLLSADPDYIWLSLGGDDILGYYSSKTGAGPNQTAIINQMILNDMRTVLNTTFTLYPNLQIVSGAYDFVNYLQSDVCLALGEYSFPECNLNTACINQAFLAYKDQVLVPLASEWPGNFFLFPFFGDLQQAGGSQYTPPPYPNAAYPSPTYLMNDGCIHASSEGWDILMTSLFNNFFASRTLQSRHLRGYSAQHSSTPGSLLSETQREWAYLNNLASKGGGPDGLPWEPLNVTQQQALAVRIQQWQQQMETANLRHDHVVDVLLQSYNASAPALSYDTVGDSCTWTSTYLAAQAFRLAATGDATAFQQVNDTLGVLELLTQCSSKPGYVVRAAMPTNDAAYAEYYNAYTMGHYSCAPPNQGLTWLGDSSRDAYIGFALGVATTQFALGSDSSRLFREQALRRRLSRFVPSVDLERSVQEQLQREAVVNAPLVERAARLATLVASTLLADGWWIVGPEGALTNPTPGFVTAWQRLALYSNDTAFAGKFDFNSSFWSAVLVDSFGVKGLFEPEYFSNNLMVDVLFVTGALDDRSDPTITATIQQLAENVGTGQGTPHQLATFAALSSCLLPNATVGQKGLMRGILESSLADLQGGLKWMTLVDQSLNPLYFPHKDSTFSEHALLAGDRPGGAFLWQDSPALLAGGLNASYLYATVDALLPYWAFQLCGGGFQV
jgi:hypothetical protein